jgi:hypothetical protein
VNPLAMGQVSNVRVPASLNVCFRDRLTYELDVAGVASTLPVRSVRYFSRLSMWSNFDCSTASDGKRQTDAIPREYRTHSKHFILAYASGMKSSWFPPLTHGQQQLMQLQMRKTTPRPLRA